MRITGLLIIAVIVGGACRSANPIAPSATPAGPVVRPTWGLSGQSNADFLRPYLAPYAEVVGYASSSVNIACFAPDDQCWLKLEPTLHQHMDAFLWWQGESDICFSCDGFLDAAGEWRPTPGAYASKLADVIRRVRAAAADPALFVVVMQLYDGRLDGEQAAFAAADGHAVVVPTRDIGFGRDGAHMLAVQYEALAGRIATMLKAGR